MNRKREFIGKVYDLLMNVAQATSSGKEDFIHYHLEYVSGRRHYEWRFSGIFGFGGKYRAHSNRVDYYREDTTPVLDALEKSLNGSLQKLKEEYQDVVF